MNIIKTLWSEEYVMEYWMIKCRILFDQVSKTASGASKEMSSTKEIQCLCPFSRHMVCVYE